MRDMEIHSKLVKHISQEELKILVKKEKNIRIKEKLLNQIMAGDAACTRG